MPYVRRNAEGEVVAVSIEPIEGFEIINENDPALRTFENRGGFHQNRLRESDLDVVRVLDDLINLLVEKNTIRFTDLPPNAQRKLIERRTLRLSGTHLGLLGEDTSLF